MMRSFAMEKTIPIILLMCDTENLEFDMRAFDLSFTLITEASSVNEEDMTKARKDQNVAFSKIVTLVTSVIDQSIVYDMYNSDIVYTSLAEFNNNLITLPNVNEMSLISALHAKFNAICSKDTCVERIRLSDKRDNLMYEYISVEEDYCNDLPDASEWNTELPYWEGCWWNRPDMNTMDRNALNEEEHSEWLRVKSESNVDDQFMTVFTEIENKFDEIFSGEQKDCEVIAVDFENQKGWTPKLID